MNKNLSEKIMKKSRPRHKFLKTGSVDDRKRYIEQRNLCVSLLRKTKKISYRKLNEKMLQAKDFWKAVKPVLSNKSVSNEKITIAENQKTLLTENKIVKNLNDFFSNTIKTLDISNFNPSDSVSDTLREKCPNMEYFPVFGLNMEIYSVNLRI